MKLKTIEGLLFLSYLTEYDITMIMSLVEMFEDLEQMSKGSKSLNISLFSKNNVDIAKKNTEKSIKAINKLNIETLGFWSDGYPDSLKTLSSPPPILFYQGNIDLAKRMVSIVGSREINNSEVKKTQDISQVVLACNYGIISGLAQGVDTIAHEEAIKNQNYTIAVVPTSLDYIYPKENRLLAEKILTSNGAILSEIAFGINRGKKSFVARNRIIVNLSKAVLPVIMGIESGTMHTIDFALSQKKKIILPDFTIDRKVNNGIKSLILKHKRNDYSNIHIVKNIDELKRKLSNMDGNSQLSLF